MLAAMSQNPFEITKGIFLDKKTFGDA